ncbi:MAG: TIGR04282 family arsenosugar biosynthesis glycosyltransferase [Thermoleophilaceae bacterium]
MSASLIVIAKAPVPGLAKTRLTPPLTPEQAAHLAEASLLDTLHAVLATPAARRILALEGEPGSWLPSGFEVVRQRGGGLADRLAGAFEDAGGPAFLVAMDTPQITPELLAGALGRLDDSDGPDAVLGPAPDGGYWGIGLRRPDAAVFDGIPMSSTYTGSLQHQRLTALELSTELLSELEDVDTLAEAQAVALAAPDTRFAAALGLSGHAADDGEAVAEAAA